MYTSPAMPLIPLESRFIYKPLRVGQVVGPGHDVKLETADGVTLHARYVLRPYAYFNLLYLHGRSGSLATRSRLLQYFVSVNANVLAVDYRGYGQSTGTPCEAGLYTDALTAYQWLVSHVPAQSVVVIGEGLGAAPACELAAAQPVAGLVSISAFSSLPQLAAAHYPWLPTGWVVRSRFDVLDKIARVQAPKLIVHSRADERVPFAMGERLFAAALEPKQALWLDAAKHGEVYSTSGEQLKIGLEQFLATLDIPS